MWNLYLSLLTRLCSLHCKGHNWTVRERDSNQLMNRDQVLFGSKSEKFPSLQKLVLVTYVDTASIVGSTVLSWVRVVGALIQIMAAHLDKNIFDGDKINSDGDPAGWYSFWQGSKQNLASRFQIVFFPMSGYRNASSPCWDIKTYPSLKASESRVARAGEGTNAVWLGNMK